MVRDVRRIQYILAGAALLATLAAAPPQADEGLFPVPYLITLKGHGSAVGGTTYPVRESGTLFLNISANAFSFETVPDQPSLFFITRGTGTVGEQPGRLVGFSTFWVGAQTDPPPPPEEIAGRMILRVKLAHDGRAFHGHWTAAVPVAGGVEFYKGRIKGRRANNPTPLR